MEGAASHAPVIAYIAERIPDSEFMLIDVGCSGGIHPVWRSFGDRLRALAVDGNVVEIERLRQAEVRPGVRYLAGLVGIAPDHPFARKMEGRSYWTRSPWERLSVVRSIEIMKSGQPQSTSEMVAANRWGEMALAEEVIVLPDYLRDHGTASVDFLKIDIDGADFNVLNSFDAALDAMGVLGVGVEVNYFGSTTETENTFHNVDRFMKARGFELFGLTVRKYSVAALPSRSVWWLPAATEFGRPLQGDALYIRDLGSHEYDAFSAQLAVPKLLNLVCLFSAFNLPDCAAEIVLRFRDRLEPACNVVRLLDLLAHQAQGPNDQPLGYEDYLRRFELNDPMFYTAR